MIYCPYSFNALDPSLDHWIDIICPPQEKIYNKSSLLKMSVIKHNYCIKMRK